MSAAGDVIKGGLQKMAAKFVAWSHGCADADWQRELRRSAVSAHEALLRHPWACSLMMSPTLARSARLHYIDVVLKSLREAGFLPELTFHAYHALDSHVLDSKI